MKKIIIILGLALGLAAAHSALAAAEAVPTQCPMASKPCVAKAKCDMCPVCKCKPCTCPSAKTCPKTSKACCMKAKKDRRAFCCVPKEANAVDCSSQNSRASLTRVGASK